MKLDIKNCNSEEIFIPDIGATVFNDGSPEFGQFVWTALANENIAKRSFVARDVEGITEKIIGTIIVDESDLFIEMTFAYVLRRYRKKHVFKAMFEKVKKYAKSIQKPIRFYCNKELCEIYEHCGCKTDNRLAVMILEENNEEKQNG